MKRLESLGYLVICTIDCQNLFFLQMAGFLSLGLGVGQENSGGIFCSRTSSSLMLLSLMGE